MKTNAILLRLDDDDYRTVSKEAAQAHISRAELVRTFLHQGLAGYDPQKEELSQKMKHLKKAVSDVQELVALVTTLVLALDVPRKPNERILEMSANFKQGASMVGGVLEAQKLGMIKS